MKMLSCRFFVLSVALMCLLAAASASATVAYDTSSQASSSGDPSLTHTPGGTAKAVLIWCTKHNDSAGVDTLTAVTYGAVSATRIGSSIKAAAEPMQVYLYVLYAGIPAGAQTVTCDFSESTFSHDLIVTTLTAATTLETVTSDCSLNSDSATNPAVTLGLTGRTSFVAINGVSGVNANTDVTPFGSWTSRFEIGFVGSTQWNFLYTYNTIGTADVSAGATQTSEDIVACSLAVSEILAGGHRGPLLGILP